jgi:hypothetical protein
VAFVSIVMVVMLVVTFFFAVIVVTFFFAVIIIVSIFMVEGHVECGVLGMNFNVISVLFFISEFYTFVRAFGESFTQVGHKYAFVIKGVFASWHGVDFDGCGCICAQG